jgi:Homing endonuclease associated repeat
LKLKPDKELILRSLAAIARGAGRPPSRSEFLSVSGISERHVSRFFPTWNQALLAAGLEPYTLNLRLEDRTILEDWASVVRHNRKIPTRRAYCLQGKYDHRTIERRFGPWSSIPQVFRDFASDKREWSDVVTLLAAAVYPKRGSHKPSLCATSIPPANKVHAPNEKFVHSPVQSKIHHSPLEDRSMYGRSLDFRGLRHEPVNEQGVVLLFGLVAKELGYIVEAVQSGFPDCEAKRQVTQDRWQRVQIEFEFESRNFRDHGHPLNGCDVIVCWRHNWPDHPGHLEILELSSQIKSLPTSTD